MMNRNSQLILPCLRGEIGDWRYYVTLLKFNEVSQRVSMVPEIHKSKGLSKLIQREVTDRTIGIVYYLKTQEQRFFNAIILGIYGGKPKWHEINVETEVGTVVYSQEEKKEQLKLKEEELNYLSSSLGILTLDGNEKIFAIDGQHRTKAIKDVLINNPELANEEITVIFVAHNKNQEGEIRTRRLFSTLNRYAKPVNKSEIIAIDEEDNCAIITRNIVENFELLSGKVLFNKNRSISLSNSVAFTNIIVLYDFIVTILTANKVFGIAVEGENFKKFTYRREPDDIIEKKQKEIESLLTELFDKVPSLKKFIEDGRIDRSAASSSLLFRPVGQNVLYSVLKVAIDKGRKNEAIAFFSKNNFNLENVVWKKVFLDEETGRMKTDKTIQKYAFQLILRKIGIHLKLSDQDRLIHENFNINPENI